MFLFLVLFFKNSLKSELDSGLGMFPCKLNDSSTPVLGKWKVNGACYLIRRFELYGSDRLDFGVVG